jgi:glycosyltransferase involved in cell wall biosynthesis
VGLAARALWSAQASGAVRRAIGAERPDVIHAHNLFPMLSPTVIRCARQEGVPFVMTLHNYRMMCLPATLIRDGRPCEDCIGRVPWPGVVHRCYRRSFAGSAALASSITLHRSLGSFDGVSLFLAVSAFILDKHVQAGIARDRLMCKPNFAWPAAARREGPGEYFLYLGRLVPEKGVGVLLEAWRQVDAALLIAGGGDLRPELERMAGPRVSFLGSVPGERALELLLRCRAMILPSTWSEGAPRSIPEAYAAGVPVIASRIGSLPEFVEDGVSGRLVPPEDPELLAEAVTELLDDGRSVAMGDEAFELWRKRFTPERGGAELEAAYARAIDAAMGPVS